MRRAPSIHQPPRKPPQCIIKPPVSKSSDNHKLPKIGCPTGETGVMDMRSVSKNLRENNMRKLTGITPKHCYSV